MDAAYFKENVLPLKNRLFRTALWMLGNEQDAEDVLQDVFIKLWQQPQSQPLNNLEAFSVRIIKNACIDFLRKKKQEHLPADALYNSPAPSSSSPTAHILSKEGSAVIERIIMSLPSEQRLVLYLRNVEEKSMKEIAMITEMSENAVTVMLSRVRKKIHAEYAKTINHEGI